MPPKQTRPRMDPLTFRLPPRLRERFIDACEAEEENPSDVLRRFVRDYVEQHPTT